MLRRYLIVNGVTTVLLYAAIYSVTPSMKSLEALRDSFEGFVMQSPVLAPLVNKVILVTSVL
ncbi:MAG: hypothetical protein JSR89_04780 [Proteobacteria bacterium]|nr:hypothetical protein [Pseudomonadota bacterium]